MTQQDIQRKANSFTSPSTYIAGFEDALKAKGVETIEKQSERVQFLINQISDLQTTVRRQQTVINRLQSRIDQPISKTAEIMPMNEYLKHIENVICMEFRIQPIELHTKSRRRDLVLVRYCIWYLLKKHYLVTLRNLGNIYGKYDHTTIIHGLNTIESMIATDERYARIINNLIQKSN
jgi:chromosomal replication initiator protein